MRLTVHVPHTIISTIDVLSPADARVIFSIPFSVVTQSINQMNSKARFSLGLVLAAAVAAATHSVEAKASISFQVSFDDPGAVYASFYDRITASVISAGTEWAGYLGSSYRAKLQVQLSFADIATASGASFTSSLSSVRGGISTYEQGAAYEMRTGIDPNGATPDIQITLGRNGYLQNELWFDPSNGKHSVPVPLNRTDARSVFLHEFGHAFAFNGWRDGSTGALPADYQSTFDALVTTRSVAGQNQLFFTGSTATSLYGGLVPLTFGNYGHVGTGADLIPGDLMNGVAFSRGTRYHVSPLDLAILRDTGFAIKPHAIDVRELALNDSMPSVSTVPEPSSYALMVMGLVAMFGVRKWRPLKSGTIKS